MEMITETHSSVLSLSLSTATGEASRHLQSGPSGWAQDRVGSSGHFEAVQVRPTDDCHQEGKGRQQMPQLWQGQSDSAPKAQPLSSAHLAAFLSLLYM